MERSLRLTRHDGSITIQSTDESTATITIDDQSYAHSTDSLTVAEATYTGGDYAVAIHDSSTGSPGPIIGWTQNISGVDTSINTTVSLDKSLKQNTTVTAMLHHSVNGPAITRGGSPVTDTAEITITSQDGSNLDLSGTNPTITTDASSVDIPLTLENTGSEAVSAPVVELTDLPSGWEIKDVAPDGGTNTSDQTQVLYLQVSPDTSVKPTWTLSLPNDISPGTYTIKGNLIRSGSVTQSVSVDITVTVEDRSTDPLQLKVADATTTPDTEVTVEFNLTNTNDTAMFAALNVTTAPAGWAITDHTNDGASAYKSSTNEWVWFSLGAGNSARPTITLSVPDGTPTDEYTIGAEALTGEFTTSATGTVTVSSTVAKPIDQAIAGSDNTISTTDLLTAVDYWQTGSEVPNTGGKTIDTTTLLNLVDKWKSGATV